MIFTWARLALALIQTANNIMRYVDRAQAVKAGTDAEIAKASAAILMKTEAAKQIMTEVTAMTDEQVDETLKRLEP